MPLRLENVFYVGEYGFVLQISTGLSLTDNLGLKGIFRRPDNTTVSSNIPVGDIVDAATGVVNLAIPMGALTVPGMYDFQIAVLKLGEVLVSDKATVRVIDPAAPLAGLFGG